MLQTQVQPSEPQGEIWAEPGTQERNKQQLGRNVLQILLAEHLQISMDTWLKKYAAIYQRLWDTSPSLRTVSKDLANGQKPNLETLKRISESIVGK